jgi:hypothetical protein
MKKAIENFLNKHEDDNPHERHLNDIAAMDTLSNGTPSPAKPIAMHTAYELDGSTDQRKLFSDNFDSLLHPDERDIIDDEVLEAAELSAMLHHPDFIMEKGENPSENQEFTRDLLMHLLLRHGVKEGYRPIMQELFRPLLNNLMDKIGEEESAIKKILAPRMVIKTPHKHEDYSKIMETRFTSPMIEGQVKNHWKDALPKIFQEINKGKHA